MIPIHTARVESSNAQNIRLALNELLTPFLLDPPDRRPTGTRMLFLIAGPFCIRTRQLVPQQVSLATCCGTAAD
jgi:hypothetical protein